MAATERTIEQRQVISHRDGDLLVSASAGSGKTTVLIEHVMELILDEEHPVDVDRLLIATFTNAAAEEMRERLAKVLDERIRQQPEDAACLRRQRLLIPHAHISTLDSFFGRLVRDHYQKLEIDPDYRIGDDGELKLLKNDVADALFEKKFKEADQGFFALVDTYAKDKSDKDLKDQLIRFHQFAQSSPDPREWIKKSAAGVAAGLEDPVLKDYVRLKKQELQSMADCLAHAQDQPLDASILTTLEKDREVLQRLIDTRDTADFFRTLDSSGFGNFKGPKLNQRTDVEWAVADLRKTIKGKLDAFSKSQGLQNPEMINEMAADLAVPLQAFADLALSFDSDYSEAKQEQNILDFNDVNHLALKLLRENDDITEELRESFEEIIIDEFQDINRLQEEILSLLSKTAEGRGNRFMVGDVKQSIYGFRMAEPDIFQDKYESFSPEEGAPRRKIDLNANFRSRRGVLDAVNAVFSRIMMPECGRVDYQNNAMLQYGAQYYEEAPDDRYRAELMLIEKQEDQVSDPEILAIARRIRDLVDRQNGLAIYDKQEGRMRRAEYRDVVILARAAGAVSADYVAALRAEGIPAIADKKTGFFNAPEIMLLTNVLRIIDDPRQDVPLMAVMVSPMFGLGEDLILNLKLDYMASNPSGTLNDTLYDACLAGEDPGLKRFLEKLDRFREYASHHSIHELITLILEETGYLYYASALTDGAVRRANVEMLLERAIDFESTSYSGIFQFNRYLEQLKKYEIDYGEADVISQQDNVVRVMSVHQSKGLEYPIVILADSSHQYNMKDSQKDIPHHPSYGIRADYIDRERNLKIKTLSKDALAAFLNRRTLEEEMRILYVAMTRAREKLIITGKVEEKKEDKKSAKEGSTMETLWQGNGPLPSWLVFSKKNDLDLIRLAVGRENPAFIINTFGENDRKSGEEQHVRGILQDRKEMEALDPRQVYDAELKARLDAIEGYVYPWQGATVNRRVYAVSDLKKKASDREIVIRAEGDEGAEDAAKRGTAYHLLMSKVDPERGTEILYIKEQLTKLMQQGQIDPLIGAQMHPEWIRSYFTSAIGKRTAEAWKEGRLYREKPFILGKPADEVDPSNSPEDMVMIKGVIDNFFLEDDGIVLIDYKTDRIRPGEEQVLADRYRTQLIYYAAALENAFKRPVKEMYLYSFVLGKVIEVRP